MHVPASDLLFLFIQIDKTDLTWVGPSHPHDIRSFGGGCVTGWRGTSALGGLCPCGVGVSVP